MMVESCSICFNGSLTANQCAGNILFHGSRMDRLAMNGMPRFRPYLTECGVGGLELSIARITERGMELHPERFCTVSVVRGRGLLAMAGEQIEITAHDHFGIPAGLAATMPDHSLREIGPFFLWN